MILWVLIDLSLAAKQFELHGSVSNAMLLVCFFQILYVTDYFYKGSSSACYPRQSRRHRCTKKQLRPSSKNAVGLHFWIEAIDLGNELGERQRTNPSGQFGDVLLQFRLKHCMRVQDIDPQYEQSNVEHFLALLDTIRPPALGGDFEAGMAHYRRAISLSGGRDLSIKVDCARYYARTLYDRELHDRLLNEVLSTDPVHEGFTLFNTLAQKEAQELLDSADDYF